MGWLMNPRLLTPAIVLISFGAALGLTGPHGGVWRAAAEHDAALPAPLRAAVTAPPTMALPTQTVAPAPDVTPEAEPAPENDTPVVVTPEEQAQESDAFLDARERAAEHGARSH
jgi:hypothetical protein